VEPSGNVIFLEAPAGAGFSYGDGDLSTSDNQTASDNYIAIQKFFEKFPSLQKNDFIEQEKVTPESIIPTLALNIIHWDADITLRDLQLEMLN